MTETPGTFFVSPSGDDTGRGSKHQPFRTIARARQAVREINTAMTSDIVVYLRGGWYELSETLAFTSRDSGTGGRWIIYKAFEGETPLISGGRRITGWREHEGGRYTAGTGGLAFRQLYVDGRKAVRARLPKGGSYFRLTRWDARARTITIDRADVRDIGSLEHAEMIVQLVWTIAVLRIRSVEERGDTVVLGFEEPESGLVFPRFHPPSWPNQAYHLENARAFLAEGNEWYLDKAGGILHFLPLNAGPAFPQTIVPHLETLVRIEGTLGRPVENVRFEGLTFAHSGWARPDDCGHLPLQAGMYSLGASSDNVSYVGRPPAAIEVSNALRVRFDRNRFVNLGATALDLRSGTRGCVVCGNLFREIAGSAILVGVFSKEDQEVHLPYLPDDEREICRDNVIENNHITRAAQEDHGCVGIGYGYAEATTIRHNEVCCLPWTGIHCGWGWTTKHSVSRDNVIRGNHVHHVVQLLIDGAAIYTLSCQPGTVIEDNHLHAIHKSAVADWRPESDATGVYLDCPGIYIDEGSGGMTVRNNLIEDIDPGAEALHYNKVFRTKEEFVFRPNVYENNGPDAEGGIRERAGPEPAYRDIGARPG
jgi:hypothetical protein